jgi:hypothetical protein
MVHFDLLKYSSPSVSMGSMSQDSTNYRSQISRKILVCTEHVKTFFLLFHKQYNITTIYFVLDIMSKLNIISSIQEDVNMLYANTIPLYIET